MILGYARGAMKILSNVLISILLSAPFVIFGLFILFGNELASILSSPTEQSYVLPIGSLMLGGIILVIGLIVSFRAIAPEPPLQDSENELARRHPSMKPAYARVLVSLPFLAGAGYLLYATDIPYVYPFVVFILGMYFFFQGAIRYIKNLHTTYVITNLRAMKMYRFLWLNTREIPTSRIVSISEARGFFELLSGRGTVVVASGVGERQVVRMQDITNPAPIADALRGLLA